MHAKRVCKDFEVKDLSEYHELYLKTDTLLLKDVFENFIKMSWKIYQLDPAKFHSASGLTWQASSKTTNVKLELLAEFDVLLMVEKRIRGGICYSINRYAKANYKYMKDCDKSKDSSYLKYWDANNLCGWEMSQKLPGNGFKWVEDTSQFNEDFIKSYNDESDKIYFFWGWCSICWKISWISSWFITFTWKNEDRKNQKLTADLHYKTEYAIHIKTSETSNKSRISF